MNAEEKAGAVRIAAGKKRNIVKEAGRAAPRNGKEIAKEAGRAAPRDGKEIAKEAGRAAPRDVKGIGKEARRAAPRDGKDIAKEAGRAAPRDVKEIGKEAGRAAPRDGKEIAKEAGHAAPRDDKEIVYETGRAAPGDERIAEQEAGVTAVAASANKEEIVKDVLEYDIKLLPRCAQLDNEVKIEVAATFPLLQAQGGELVAPSLNLPQTHIKEEGKVEGKKLKEIVRQHSQLVGYPFKRRVQEKRGRVQPEHSDEKSKYEPKIKHECKGKHLDENLEGIYDIKHEHKDGKDSDVKLIELELISDHSSIKSSMLPQKTDKLDLKNVKCKLEPQNSKAKNRKGKSNVKDLDKMQEKNVEKKKVLQDVNRGKGKGIKVEKQKANESAQDKYEKKKEIVQNKTIGDTVEDEEKKALIEIKDKELKDDENSKANKPGIFAMQTPRNEKYYKNVKSHDKSKDILADISKRARKESVELKKVDESIDVVRDIATSHKKVKIVSIKMNEVDRDRAVRPTAPTRTQIGPHSRDRVITSRPGQDLYKTFIVDIHVTGSSPPGVTRPPNKATNMDIQLSTNADSASGRGMLRHFMASTLKPVLLLRPHSTRQDWHVVRVSGGPASFQLDLNSRKGH